MGGPHTNGVNPVENTSLFFRTNKKQTHGFYERYVNHLIPRTSVKNSLIYFYTRKCMSLSGRRRDTCTVSIAFLFIVLVVFHRFFFLFLSLNNIALMRFQQTTMYNKTRLFLFLLLFPYNV